MVPRVWCRLALAVLLGGAGVFGRAGEPAGMAAPRKVFIAGDSTAASYTNDAKQGWGAVVGNYLDPTKAVVVNRAMAGRSSRTYLTGGHWEKLVAEIQPGDVVLIQFGHNDGGAINEEPPGSTAPLRARGSLPGLGEEQVDILNAVTHQPETVRTYGWYLRRMIADARKRGATPVLMSTTARNIWSDGKVERGLRQHRAWARQVAANEGVDFIDLSRMIADEYQRRGPEQVAALFAGDHTHTNAAGAELNASLVIASLKGLRQRGWGELMAPAGRQVPADQIGWLNLPEPANPALPTICLIGDSTVRNGAGDGQGGQWGWGEPLAELLDPAKVNVVNRAIGGLTGRTFLTQGHWERALMLLKRGDVLLMQFGHNDGGAINDQSRARGTLKGVGEETEEIDNLLTGQHEVVHTHGWYLREFIREARAAGVTPVVCSLVPRKKWQPDGTVARSRETFAGWARQVAAEESAAFIDLNDLIATRYEQLGREKVEAFFADEHTHTSRAGADGNARIVAEELAKVPGVGDLVRSARR